MGEQLFLLNYLLLRNPTILSQVDLGALNLRGDRVLLVRAIKHPAVHQFWESAIQRPQLERDGPLLRALLQLVTPSPYLPNPLQCLQT